MKNLNQLKKLFESTQDHLTALIANFATYVELCKNYLIASF